MITTPSPAESRGMRTTGIPRCLSAGAAARRPRPFPAAWSATHRWRCWSPGWLWSRRAVLLGRGWPGRESLAELRSGRLRAGRAGPGRRRLRRPTGENVVISPVRRRVDKATETRLAEFAAAYAGVLAEVAAVARPRCWPPPTAGPCCCRSPWPEPRPGGEAAGRSREDAAGWSGAMLAVTAAVPRPHPELRVRPGRRRARSTTVGKAWTRDFQRAELLAAGHPGRPAGRLRRRGRGRGCRCCSG